MVFKRIRQSLTNDEGAATPMILCFVILAIIGFVVLFQYFYTAATVNIIHDSCRSTATSALMANAEASYQAKRDGYTGVWNLDDGEVTNTSVYIDPVAHLADQLDLIRDGDALVKLDGEDQVYRLRDIRVDIENPAFQDEDNPLIATVSLTADVVLTFPLVDHVSVPVPISVSASWNPKF